MEKLLELVKKVCNEKLVSLYDLEIKSTSKGKVIAVYITKIDGVTISDCKRVSKEVSNILEEENYLGGNFFLEVSSPGLERKLTKKMHYKSAIGESVKIVFQEEGISKTVTGILKEVDTDFIVVSDNEEIRVEFQTIKKANTIFIDGIRSKNER
jgi:ribosome maturation factor RimP